MTKFNKKKLVHCVIDKRFAIEFKKQKRLGVRELGKEIGISSSTVSRLISGREIDIDTLIRVCDWLGRKINYFVY